MSLVLKELEKTSERLLRDESGVALMMTLAVILFLYVLLSGVYTIGETVRKKIELQNACDAAAYSAAVVQADGLSRMAMVNRAMSWTYVQMTNMQMDYITYKWLRLVRERFTEDSNNCDKHNRNSQFMGDCPDILNLRSWYVGKNRGWFCGLVNEGSDMISLNGRSVSIQDIDDVLDRCKGVLEYGERVNSTEGGELIQNLKNIMGTLDLMPSSIAEKMHTSATLAATTVLHENLPREIRSHETSNASGEVWLSGDRAISLGRDYAYKVIVPFPHDPYLDDSTGSCFSPLYNTELDERIFLSMGDGAVYTRLADYFYRPDQTDNYARDSAGGLDQWFIRGYPDESNMDVDTVPDDFEKQYRSLGICRVYKNANRREGGKVLRGHHTGLLLTDTAPSTYNCRENFPDQCSTVRDKTIGLCADYEWGALQIITACVGPYGKIPMCTHVQTGIPILTCRHLCETGVASGNHARSGFKACFINAALLVTSWAMASREVETLFVPGTHPHVNLYDSILSRQATVQGFSRTYGDDASIYNSDVYTGTPALPWILNEKFYQKDGAIVVGLACRQRNPWVWLLDSVVPYEREKVPGIYSVFDPPGQDPYIVALSAARAAHRVNQTDDNKAGISREGLTARTTYGNRIYEVAYDAVCADDWSTLGSGFHPTISISPGGPSSDRDDLARMRVGCVCGRANAERFARCWNLCETDWDAMLLPVSYAWAEAHTGASWWHDSYLVDLGQEGQVAWESVSSQNARFAGDPGAGVNLFRYLATESHNWFSFYDSSGKLITEANGPDRAGDIVPLFLRRTDPERILESMYH